jgi:YfiH family protein
MPKEFIANKVYYKIFDKTYKQSSHIYTRYRRGNEEKIAEIEQNRQAILSQLSATNIFFLHQIHSNKVIDTDNFKSCDMEPQGDAFVTTKAGLALAIQTADCVPILCSSSNGEVIGAAHCGWRGTKLGIIANLIDIMRRKGASTIKAIIGPSIQQQSYEVDQEYYNSFIDEEANYAKFFLPSKNSGHYMFDLPGLVGHKLKEAGISDITKIIEDTYTMHEKYPSYRRSYHSGEQYKESILSTIIIRP